MSPVNHHDNFDRSSENSESLQWNDLRKLCHVSVEYFTSHRLKNSDRIKAALLVILQQLDELQPLYNEIAKYVSCFDFDETTPGNGYRSFLLMIDKSIVHSEQVCQKMYRQKDSLLFRESHHTKEVEACSQLLVSLQIYFPCLKTLYKWSSPEIMSDGRPSLIVTDKNHSSQEFLGLIEHINQHCFYGRCIAFQFCDSLKKAIIVITSAMAAYSEIFYNNNTILRRCVNCIQYFLDPEARARRLVNISQYADIYFTRAYWSLLEMKILYIFYPSLAVNQQICIPLEEIILPTLDGGTVSIPMPNSHIGKKPINLKLLSFKRRVGMIGSGREGGELYDPCDSLIIYIHGGGFIAQTSQSHVMYLHKWTEMLDVPILCIDYSLAPEAPYPRSLEEALYSYAWALNHATVLGSTAKRVILIGDSAGGALCLQIIFRCVQLNIRKPTGIFVAYPPGIMDFLPSPSHMFFLNDPFLLLGTVIRIIKAYVETDKDKFAKHENEKWAKLDAENSFAEVNKNDLTAMHPNENSAKNIVSLPSNSTLNSVNSREVDGQSDKSCLLFRWFLDRRNNKNIRQLDIKNAKTPLEEFVLMKRKVDLLTSPCLVSDNVLVNFPPTKIMAAQFDPFLDDCVTFARRLRSLGNNVTLDVMSDVPHGFLNLINVSKEAREGMKLGATRIKELLEL
ncbi:hormone-sensitive lipase-like isoform X2 [Nylanderia fulva]|uniref:hormone-sensitive lipase-like isoform X2 n=1 Tax=Nylanderia fulva TaxID=613905 RepID=UPI0010FB8250|nr:hormone-sensitive lipase-like isoform X2 [Nylanderia fulva]